jgi:hypothetical protein
MLLRVECSARPQVVNDSSLLATETLVYYCSTRGKINASHDAAICQRSKHSRTSTTAAYQGTYNSRPLAVYVAIFLQKHPSARP